MSTEQGTDDGECYLDVTQNMNYLKKTITNISDKTIALIIGYLSMLMQSRAGIIISDALISTIIFYTFNFEYFTKNTKF